MHPDQEDSDRPSMVHDVSIVLGGKTHVATYYIEDNLIHIMVGERTLTAPVARMPAAQTVQELVERVLGQEDDKPHSGVRARDL